MAANLLLEGPDLEALLMRAHREGGTKARIVRAEKVRRGGVFGFFATEAFEVAVEIPDEAAAAPAAAAAPTTPTTPAAPAVANRTTPADPGTPGAATSPSPSQPNGSNGSGGPQVTEATPIPTGLLGLAERANAAERAGESISRTTEYQFADRTLGTIPGFQRPVFPDNGNWPTGGAAMAATAPVLSQGDVQVLAEPDLAEPDLAEPDLAAPPIRLADGESVTPPGDRPQFTSLIDQLREGIRDGRHREEGVRHTTDHPVVAALHAGLTDEQDTDGLTGTSTEHIVSALEAEAWARVMTDSEELDVQGSTTATGTDGSTMSDPAAARYESDLGRLQDEPEEITTSSALPNARAATIVPSKPSRRRGRGVPSQRHPETVHPDPTRPDLAPDEHDRPGASATATAPAPADYAGSDDALSGVTFMTDPMTGPASSLTTDLPPSHPTSAGSTTDAPPAYGSPDAPATTGPATVVPDGSPAESSAAGSHRAPEADETEAEHEFDDQPRKASWWRLGRKRREDVTRQAQLWTPSDEDIVPLPDERTVGSLAPLESFGRLGAQAHGEKPGSDQPAERPLTPLTPPPGFEPLVASAERHTGPHAGPQTGNELHTGQHRVRPDAGLANAGLANAGLANAGLANAGLAGAGRTDSDELDELATLGVERFPAISVPGGITGSTGSTGSTGGFTAAAMQGAPAMPAASVIEDGDELAEDRQTLRDLGIPAAWTRRLQPGDRFTSVLGILDRMPVLEISEDAAVIAVVGAPDVVQLEAHRTALDLPADGQPRAVAVVPAQAGSANRAEVADANGIRPVVVAVPIAPGTDLADVRATITALHADAVIAVVDASLSTQDMIEYFDGLERVDAVAMDGALEAEQPAAVLALDVPVVRLDGISMDRIGWAALLCAQLAARSLTDRDLEGVGAEAL